jgi:Zn-dependent membrane protease YugP
MFMAGNDLIYWALIGFCALLSFAASGYVKLRFAKGQAVPLRSGYTGAEVARMIMREEGVTDVTVQEHEGFLSDHYNPMDKTLNLSPDVYNGVNAAAAGVAAHECGHALQHHLGDLSMWGRTILVYPAMFGNNLGPLLVMVGVAFGGAQHYLGHSHHAFAGWAGYLIMAGLIFFAVATLCSIIVVFNEFNASARARAVLQRIGITSGGEEDETVRGVLIAAGLTYVAAATTAILQMLYWMWQAGLFGNRSDDR